MPTERFPRGDEIRGVAFPITKGREGYWPRRNAAALRQSSILMILGTAPGERLMLPEFGSRLPFLLFEPNDQYLAKSVQDETAGALGRWDPNLVILGVSPEMQADNSLKVFIDYMDLRDLNQEKRRMVFNLRRL